MEHLLNNAAQAIETVEPMADGHAIRVAVSHDECSLHVIVSDTGPGFGGAGVGVGAVLSDAAAGGGVGAGAEYLLRDCAGAWLGRSVRSNLHPQGAAVVVELPVGRAVRGDCGVLAEVGIPQGVLLG